MQMAANTEKESSRVLQMYYKKKYNMKNNFKSVHSRTYSSLSKRLKMKKAKIFKIIRDMQPVVSLERYSFLKTNVSKRN